MIYVNSSISTYFPQYTNTSINRELCCPILISLLAIPFPPHFFIDSALNKFRSYYIYEKDILYGGYLEMYFLSTTRQTYEY